MVLDSCATKCKSAFITRREVLSQTAWCMRMPAATETLKESTMPFIGILQSKSDSSRASSLIPLQAATQPSLLKFTTTKMF